MKVKLLYGGGGSEDSISIRSKDYIKSQLTRYDVEEVYLQNNYLEVFQNLSKKDFVIPCIHGPPGESGELLATLELLNIPFLGCGSKASFLCFDKIQTKLFLDANDIKTTPFTILNSASDFKKATDFFDQHNGCFIKASSEGSSVGCYLVTDKSELQAKIDQAFQYSPKVLVEKIVSGREVEVAAFEFQNKIHATHPGEIIIGDTFYSYDEKYSETSQSKTMVQAENISSDLKKLIDQSAQKAFSICKLKDLSRIDFFIENNQVYLNEINTFPGMTSISLFPKMLEAHQMCTFKNFLEEKIDASMTLTN